MTGPDDTFDEGYVADEHEPLIVAPPPTPTRGSRIWWSVTGLVMGLGTLGIAVSWYGVGALVVGSILAAISWRKYRWGTSSIGWIVFGTIPSLVLAAAAVTKRGCPEPGKLFILEEGEPPVDCSQIVASYASMSIFFAMVAIAGAFIPAFIRRQRRLSLEERYLDEHAQEDVS